MKGGCSHLLSTAPDAASQVACSSNARVPGSPESAAVSVEPVIPVPAAPQSATELRPSIAVLPFTDMSENRDQEYFADGIAEELLNLLAGIPELRVIARTSSFAYKGKEIPIQEIARQLNVAYLLEGSIRKSGDKIRITAQLIDAENSSHLWSQTWDRKLLSALSCKTILAPTRSLLKRI